MGDAVNRLSGGCDVSILFNPESDIKRKTIIFRKRKQVTVSS